MSVGAHAQPVVHHLTPGATPARITTVALVTRDRVDTLVRGLTSYVENVRRHGRTAEFVVLDNSESLETGAAYRQALGSIASRLGVTVTYAGLEAKRRFARRLIDHGDLPPAVAEFALFDVERCRHASGTNRNALLLHCAGELLLSVDDDTVCQVAMPPVREPGLACVTGRDPAQFWFFPDRDATLRSVMFKEVDLLAIHEELLGRRTVDLCLRVPTSPTSDVAMGRLRRRVQSPRTTVAVTFNGLAGDCAWGAPFGWWGAPLGYLLLDGSSHERLVRSAADYRMACCSREVLRIVEQTTLSDATFSMTTFAGLDNRRLLPPFMPVRRGQDIIFGSILWRCFEDSCFGHLPWALVHAPVPSRRFWPGEMVRSASGFDTAKLILACMPASDDDTATGSGLAGLGAHFIDLGKRPVREFDAYLRERMTRINGSFAEQLEQRLHACGESPEYWANDVRRYVGLLREATRRPDYCVPLDLLDGRGVGEARVLAQRLVLRYGELLTWWPRMMEIAVELRARGERLATAV